MTFAAFNLLFPVLLAIHNLEEYSRCDEFIRVYPGRLAQRFTTRRVVRDAATLLTLAAAGISVLAYALRAEILIRISQVAIFALALNAIGHCVVSIRRRRFMPGTFSAITLVLPYSAVAIVMMHVGLGEPMAALVGWALLGGAALPIVIVLFLAMGYGLSRLFRPRSRTGTALPGGEAHP